MIAPCRFDDRAVAPGAARRPAAGARRDPHLRRRRRSRWSSSSAGTKLLINWLTRLKIGQPIHEDVPEGHTTKAGTPTMGGVAIVVAVGRQLRRLGHVPRHLHRARPAGGRRHRRCRPGRAWSTTGSRSATSGTSGSASGRSCWAWCTIAARLRRSCWSPRPTSTPTLSFTRWNSFGHRARQGRVGRLGRVPHPQLRQRRQPHRRARRAGRGLGDLRLSARSSSSASGRSATPASTS